MLTFKLIRAFLIVSVTGALLAAVLTRWMAVREFERLVLAQAESSFIYIMSAHYETNGSWEGATAALSRPFPSTGEAPRPIRPLPPQPPEQASYVFALADANGRIVVPGRSYRLGDTLSAAQLAEGTAVTVNGELVGAALATGEAPPLDLREEQYLAQTNIALLYAALGAAAVALILGVLLARSLTRPLQELTTAVHRMADGDLKQEVPVRSQDELGQLAAAFNKMSADLEQATQSRRQMTADIAHDLRTPLTVIAGYIESMQDGVLQPTPARLATIYQEVEHLQRLVADLNTLSKADAGELTLNRQPIAPRNLLERVANTYRHEAQRRGIELTAQTAVDAPSVSMDEERMAQLLGNLVANGLRYTPDGGTIRLTAIASPLPDYDLRLTVEDSGAGIAAEHLPRIFDRFYRADEARTGEGGESGLGLAIAKSLAAAHGGTITAVSDGLGKGTTFIIELAK